MPVDFQARPFEPSPAPRDEAREPVEVWRETYYWVLNTPGIMPPVGWRGLPGDYQREQALIAACNAVAAAPRADPTQTQVNAAADVLRFHEHWNMLPLDAEAWIVARKMLDAARLPESKQSDDWQTIKAECDSWWIAAIADEAPFVVTRIRKRVEAYAAARAPGRAE